MRTSSQMKTLSSNTRSARRNVGIVATTSTSARTKPKIPNAPRLEPVSTARRARVPDSGLHSTHKPGQQNVRKQQAVSHIYTIDQLPDCCGLYEKRSRQSHEKNGYRNISIYDPTHTCMVDHFSKGQNSKTMSVLGRRDSNSLSQDNVLGQSSIG